jgi:hypothetical protein
MAKVESKLQGLKEKMALTQDFNLVDGFRMISRGSDLVDKEMLRQFIETHQISDPTLEVDSSEKTMRLVMCRLDSNYKGNFCFDEFSQEFLPVDKQYAEVILQRMPKVRDSGPYPMSYEAT